MLTSRLEPQLEQRGVRKSFADAVMSHRVAPFSRATYDLSTAADIGVGNVSLDRASILTRHALHDREIPTVERMLAEERASGSVRLTRQSRRERSGRAAIESVQHTEIATATIETPCVLLQAPEHRVLGGTHLPTTGNGEETSGLIDDENLIVFVETRKIEARRRHGRPRGVDVDDRRGWNIDCSVALDFPVDCDLATRNGVADLRPRQIRTKRAQPVVESAQGCLPQFPVSSYQYKVET